jgi:hypothetical protein
MPELAVDNGASLGIAITAAHKDIVALQSGIGGLTDIAKTTSDSCVRIDTTLGSLLAIEQEKLAHKKRMQEKQWAFILDNWKIIAFIVAVLWMPEAVPSIVGALVPGLGNPQHQVVIVPTSAAAGIAPAAVEEEVEAPN